MFETPHERGLRLEAEIAKVGLGDLYLVHKSFPSTYTEVRTTLIHCRFALVRDLALELPRLYVRLCKSACPLLDYSGASIVYALKHFIASSQNVSAVFPLAAYTDSAFVVAYVVEKIATADDQLQRPLAKGR